jgi:NitT/TauT family transport system substrate-binding protein
MNCARREFARGLTLAGTAALLGARLDTASAEPPPETTRIRLVRRPQLCEAPQYVAEELLLGEGGGSSTS